MNKLLTNVKNIPKAFKNNFTLFILALADVAIMAIPFYLENYVPNINGNLKLRSPADYSQAGAIYGFVAIPCYLLGSYLGDKFRSKSLIVSGLFLTAMFGAWYTVLPFMAQVTSSDMIKWQLFIIFAGFSFATCALFWAPLWKLVKNQNIDHLPENQREKQVGKNNGIQGMLNGLIGLSIALLGTLLLFLSEKGILPNIGGKISAGFIILISIYAALILLSGILTIFFIKEAKMKEQFSFSFKAIIDVLKEKTIWMLAILVLGVYMLQMGLSSYVNYLKNIFIVPTVVVSVIGIFRTYVMRFMISGWFGKFADRKHSYILLILIGLMIGITLIGVAILLPGFSGEFIEKHKVSQIILQIAACLNLILLGAVTWAVVTIRWSPIGTELGIKNSNYAAAVNIVSIIAFTPDAFFKQIKSAIESNHNMVLPDGTIVANQAGNQLILLTVVSFAFIGLLSGIALYFTLHKRNKKAIFTNDQVLA